MIGRCRMCPARGYALWARLQCGGPPARLPMSRFYSLNRFGPETMWPVANSFLERDRGSLGPCARAHRREARSGERELRPHGSRLRLQAPMRRVHVKNEVRPVASHPGRSAEKTAKRTRRMDVRHARSVGWAKNPSACRRSVISISDDSKTAGTRLYSREQYGFAAAPFTRR